MSIPKCNFCGQLYATTALLSTHIQQNHAQNSQPNQVFTCRLCNQVFQTKDTLLEHLSLYHQEERQKICNKCNYICTGFNQLMQHLKQVHPKEYAGQNSQIAERLNYPIQQNNQPYQQVPKQTSSNLGTTPVSYTVDDPEVLLQQMQTYFGLAREQIINGNYSTSVLKTGLLKMTMFMKNDYKDQIIKVFKPDEKIEKPKNEQIEQSQQLQGKTKKKDENQINIVVKSAKGMLNHIEQVTKHKIDKFVDGRPEITLIQPNQERILFKIKNGMEFVVHAAIQDYQSKSQKSNTINKPDVNNQINAPSLPIKQQPFVNNSTLYYPVSSVQNKQITPPVICTQSTPSNQWKITIPLSTAAQGLPQQLYQYLLQNIGNISVIQLLPDQSIVIQCTISNYSNVIKVVQVIQVYGQSIKYNVERM
ncbi:transcription_factor hamlet-like [Hexamita inflata]|uniref:Transcription factor hamlet-like n=1 Tax=Hexamita inflata TaxID=28002 RepID=A0AA86V1T4_9EUKA|nr:transcription factor hamlet-like [Hexamita inflata]